LQNLTGLKVQLVENLLVGRLGVALDDDPADAIRLLRILRRNAQLLKPFACFSSFLVIAAFSSCSCFANCAFIAWTRSSSFSRSSTDFSAGGGGGVGAGGG